jgi:hypothetical protein
MLTQLISHQRCKFDSNLHLQKCHQCIKLGIPCNFKLSSQGRRNGIKLHPPPLQDTSHVAIEPVHEMNNVDYFSGFSDPGGRFAITNESVHYPHQSGFCLNNGYSCHGCVEQVKPQELNLPVPFHPGFMFFPSPPSHAPVKHKLPLLIIWRNPPPK